MAGSASSAGPPAVHAQAPLISDQEIEEWNESMDRQEARAAVRMQVTADMMDKSLLRKLKMPEDEVVQAHNAFSQRTLKNFKAEATRFKDNPAERVALDAERMGNARCVVLPQPKRRREETLGNWERRCDEVQEQEDRVNSLALSRVPGTPQQLDDPLKVPVWSKSKNE